MCTTPCFRNARLVEEKFPTAGLSSLLAKRAPIRIRNLRWDSDPSVEKKVDHHDVPANPGRGSPPRRWLLADCEVQGSIHQDLYMFPFLGHLPHLTYSIWSVRVCVRV